MEDSGGTRGAAKEEEGNERSEVRKVVKLNLKSNISKIYISVCSVNRNIFRF